MADQVTGTGDLVNPAGQDIGDYSTNAGPPQSVTINGENSVYHYDTSGAYYHPDYAHATYRLIFTCRQSNADGCCRWDIRKQTPDGNGGWVDDASSGQNQLVKTS